MKVDALQQELRQWGELIITTAAGDTFEFHLGDDIEFDSQENSLKLATPEGKYTISCDGIDQVKKHYGHKVQ